MSDKKNLHSSYLEEAVQRAAPWASLLQDKPILVTGASGFLASSLVIFLTKLDSVFGLNLKIHASARRKAEQVPLFGYLDVAPPSQWQLASIERTELPSEPGLISVHTASYGSPKDYQMHPMETFESNTKGVQLLFEASSALPRASVVYLSSAEIYGQPPAQYIPTAESYTGGLDTMDVRSIYGESKRMAEVVGACLSRSTGVPFTVIRPWNLYGPGQRPRDGRVPLEFIRQALEQPSIHLLSDGTPRRSFCYVWDGILQLTRLLAADAQGKAWNIGNQYGEITILEAARQCARAAGKGEDMVTWDSSAKAPGMQRSVPDVGAVSQLLGHHAGTSLELGLQTVVDWLKWHHQTYGSQTN